MGEEEVKENKYGKVTINSTREQTLTGLQPEGTIGASVGAVATSTSFDNRDFITAPAGGGGSYSAAHSFVP